MSEEAMCKEPPTSQPRLRRSKLTSASQLKKSSSNSNSNSNNSNSSGSSSDTKSIDESEHRSRSSSCGGSSQLVDGGKSSSKPSSPTTIQKHDAVDSCIMASFVVFVVFLVLLFVYLYIRLGSAFSELVSNDRLRNFGGRKVQTEHFNYQVTLKDLYTGGKFVVSLPQQVVCEDCQGSGVDLSKGYSECSHCEGKGFQVFRQRIFGGVQNIRMQCASCGGTGKHARASCPKCHGSRVFRRQKDYQLTISPGMQHGDVLMFQGMGNEAPHAAPGDMVFHLQQITSKRDRFIRKGSDLLTTLEISLLEALIGFTREINHLDDHPVVVKRDVVTQPNSTMVVSGEGMPIRGFSQRYGNLIFQFDIKFPPSLTELQRKRIHELFPMPNT